MGWGGARPNSGPKPKGDSAKRAPSSKAAPAKATGRALVKVGHDALALSKQNPGKKVHPFILANHPPSVFPSGVRPTLAMDEAVNASLAWSAQAILNGMFAEGLGFLGYPYLAELTQRAEYRVISETIATEATRKWIKIQAVAVPAEAKPGEDPAATPKPGEKSDKIKALEVEFDRLKVQDVFRLASEQDGFFGRSHIFIDIGDARDDRDELKTPIGNGRNEISVAKIQKGSLKRLQNVEPIWCYPSVYNATDPLAPQWYDPEMWFCMGKELHKSRLLTFVGREVPDLLKPAYSFGGLSLSQIAKPYVDNWLRTRQSVADIVHAFSVMVLTTDLSESLSAGGEELFRRLDFFNNTRDNRGIMAVNKDTEDLKNVSAPLSSLDLLQAQTQEHMAAVSKIPIVKLLGIQPAGLNASSEGEINSFDDTIAAYQQKFFGEPLKRILGFAQLNLWGEIDPGITATFQPLRQMTEKEQGEIDKLEAETDQIRIDTGVLSPEEARTALAAKEDSRFAGIDVDDVPDLADEEDAGLEPDGGWPEDPNEIVEGGGQDATIRPFAFDDFNEADHPRGQPENAGQFGSGGGGGQKPQHKGKADPGSGSSGGGGKETGGSKQSGAPERKLADSSKLYKPSTKTADELVAEFPGGSEAIQKTRQRIAESVPSDALVSEGGFRNPDGTYTPERQALHQEIVDKIFTPEAIARAKPAPGEKPTLTMLGGRGGSGKSWLTSDKGPVDGSKALLLDSDGLRSHLPGYEGWNTSLFHEEATEILNLADRRALALGLNTIHDATMKSESTAAMRMALYEAAGYEVEGYYMHASPEVATTRAMARYSKNGTFTGRFVPPEVILGNVNNEKNFDKLSGGMRKWAVYENNTAAGPKIFSKSEDRL